MEEELAKMPVRGDSGSWGQGGRKVVSQGWGEKEQDLPWVGGETGERGEREVLPFLQPVNSARKI